MHLLAKAGDTEGLRGLIRESSDVPAIINELDKQGYSALYYAVARGAPIEVIELLLEAGADPGFERVRPIGIFPDGIVGDAANALLNTLVGGHGPHEFREPVLAAALNRGEVDVVELFRRHGAELAYRDKDGYTAMQHAMFGPGDRLPLIEYLIGLGLELNGTSAYGESAIRSAYHYGAFSVVRALLDAGADDDGLKWTRLMRAVTVGSLDDVEHQLAGSPDLEPRDTWDRTAIHVALLRGDRRIVEALVREGADLSWPGQLGSSSLAYAVEGGSSELVEWLVQQGHDVEGLDAVRSTCLAGAAERGDRDMVRTLLRLGADPDAKMEYSTVASGVTDRETLLILLEHGLDTSSLSHEGRRLLLGLGEEDADRLDGLGRDEYLAGRYLAEGRDNPEERNDPYQIAMVQAGIDAYWARDRFEDPASFACGLGGSRPPAVWCARRFGQSTTILPDGRIVLIAGEHEDSYDPDFCIYNDVFLFESDSSIRVFNYPYTVFPPTDSHTATLVGEFIYMVGSLGYPEDRTYEVPVYRLSLSDFHIEPLRTTGTSPGRIYKHRAELLDGESIRISRGTVIASIHGEEAFSTNNSVFRLDLGTLVWTREDGA